MALQTCMMDYMRSEDEDDIGGDRDWDREMGRGNISGRIPLDSFSNTPRSHLLFLIQQNTPSNRYCLKEWTRRSDTLSPIIIIIKGLGALACVMEGLQNPSHGIVTKFLKCCWIGLNSSLMAKFHYMGYRPIQWKLQLIHPKGRTVQFKKNGKSGNSKKGERGYYKSHFCCYQKVTL